MWPPPTLVASGLLVALVLLGFALGPADARTPGASPSVNPTQPPPPIVVATLRFDGMDASTATSTGAAIPVDVGSALPVAFVWSAKGGKLGEPGLVAVASEHLDLRFLGASAMTNTHLENGVVLASNGSASYTIAYPSYRWVVEGLFSVVASLVAPNGTTLWSLGFFVHVEAPYHATVANVGGVAVAAYVLAALALGPRRRPGEAPRKPQSTDGEPGAPTGPL